MLEYFDASIAYWPYWLSRLTRNMKEMTASTEDVKPRELARVAMAAVR